LLDIVGRSQPGRVPDGIASHRRPIVDLFTTAGFTITELDVFYRKSAPKFGGGYSLGTAKSH
jgi:hypothetical protein